MQRVLLSYDVTRTSLLQYKTLSEIVTPTVEIWQILAYPPALPQSDSIGRCWPCWACDGERKLAVSLHTGMHSQGRHLQLAYHFPYFDCSFPLKTDMHNMLPGVAMASTAQKMEYEFTFPVQTTPPALPSSMC